MKLIFLDFDGVITTKFSNWNIDSEKCKLIKELCDKTGAKIVISSSWRQYSLQFTIETYKLENWILTPYLVGITKDIEILYPSLAHANISCMPIRGLEINMYLEESKDRIDNYCIIDDGLDFLYIQKDHIVRTQTYLGVQENDIEKAIKILNNEL